MEEVQLPPPVQMMQLLWGFQLSQALYVAAKLGVADELGEGPRPVDAIADAVGAQPELLARILRVLASVGVFSEVEHGVFARTPLGATLAADEPGSMRNLALTWMETHYVPFSRLVDTVKAGTPAAELHYGEPMFDWLAKDPYHVEVFSAAMADVGAGIRAAALTTLDVSDLGTLVDVGGADGTMRSMVLANAPGTRGVLFDLPHVVPSASAVLERENLADRVEVIGGDFFAALPSGDGYLISQVLHDWNDDEAVQILRNVAAAGGSGARLVLIEVVVPPGG